MNNQQERRNYLNTLRYGEVKKIATQLKVATTGGAAAMITRILEKELELQGQEQIASLPEQQIQHQQQNLAIGQENGEIAQLRQDLSRVMQTIDQHLKDNEKATMDLITHIEEQTPDFNRSKVTVKQTVEKFWPDKRLRSFDLQAEFDHHMKLGRMITACKLQRSEDLEFQATAKEMESLIF